MHRRRDEQPYRSDFGRNHFSCIARFFWRLRRSGDPTANQPVVEVARPAFSWTGPYVGAYIGNTKLDLKSTGEIHHDAITVEHDAITEEIPAEVIEHPEVTEDRVVEVIEHPEVTEEKVVKEIDHPAIVEKIPAVTKEHPEVKEKVTVGWEEVQIGTETVKVREDVYRDENGEKQRDENHHTGWRHVPVYEEVPVYENRPIYEERVVQDAWVEVISPEKEVVIKDAWTETVTETVVVQEAWSKKSPRPSWCRKPGPRS